MKFIKEHPYTVAFVLLVVVGGIVVLVQKQAKKARLKKEAAALALATPAGTPAAGSLLSEFDTNPFFTGATTTQYDKSLTK
jgi:hypothetical protein